MTLDIEARVRRANLVTRDEQLDQLFGEDLSARLLGHIDALKEGRMSETKSHQKTDGTIGDKTDMPALPPARGKPPRPRWVAAVVTAALILAAGGILILLAGGDDPDAPVATDPVPIEEPVEVEEEAVEEAEADAVEADAAEAVAIAEAYIEARNAYDASAILNLVADDVTFNEVVSNDVEELEALMEGERVGSFQYSPFSCEPFTREGWVSCTYMADSRFQQIVGYPPIEGEFLFAVSDGRLTLVQNIWPFEEFEANAFVPWIQWLRAEHPDDFEVLYPSDRVGPAMTPESLELHQRYLDEYEDWVSSQDG